MNKSCIAALCTAALALTMTTQVHARTGGPDSFGYTFVDSDTDPSLINYMDISGTGNQVVFPGDPDDSIAGPVSIDFMFNFYGTEYMQLNISSNGFLTFLDGQDSAPNEADLPTTGDPDALIAGWWGDLDPSDRGGGSIYTQTMGSAPDRIFIVQFTDVEFFNEPSTKAATFQFKLFEGSNNIEVQYQRLDDTLGYNAGIENQSGDDGLEYTEDVDIPLPGAVLYKFPNNPPDCIAAQPSIERLWPPNHKFVPIEILGVTDPDGDPVNITIDSIFQDEPLNTFGDGNTQPDGKGVGTSIAHVRSERSGNKKVPGNGRVYHIGFTADDGIEECTGVVTVAGVPHDQGRKGRVIIDGGPLYDSTVVPANSRPGNSNNASKKSRGKKKK